MWPFRNTTHSKLDNILARIGHMAVDVSKVKASEQALVGKVNDLLAMAASNASKLADISAQLAAAIAANDPAAQAQVQADLDALSADMDAEATKVGAVTDPVPAPVPTPAA